MTQSSISHTASSVVVCIPECKGQSGVVDGAHGKDCQKDKMLGYIPH